MTTERTLELQEKILQLCHAAGEYGLDEDRLKRTLIRHHYAKDDDDDDTVERQLKFLKGEGFLSTEEERTRPDFRRWKTTSEGDKHLMRLGAI